MPQADQRRDFDELTVIDNCPLCGAPHVWCDPIGPAPKAWGWDCGTNLVGGNGLTQRHRCRIRQLEQQLEELRGRERTLLAAMEKVGEIMERLVKSKHA